MTAPKHRLCIYCGSSTGNKPEFAAVARDLGRTMAEAGIGLVYGGGSVGLMGEVARAVLAAGGHVTGIIPDFLVSKERMLDGVNELIVTRTMHERKMGMFERSTGFVALPGGIGTLEELAAASGVSGVTLLVDSGHAMASVTNSFPPGKPMMDILTGRVNLA